MHRPLAPYFPLQRQFYDLESFYATAEEVELPFEVERSTDEQGEPRWTRQQPPVA